MKALYPKISKVLSAYAIPKIESVYSKKVQGHEFQGHYGFQGKYYGKFASKINPYKGGEKNQ
jgi:hypothetical protein